jgi:hypothetical protein
MQRVHRIGPFSGDPGHPAVRPWGAVVNSSPLASVIDDKSHDDKSKEHAVAKGKISGRAEAEKLPPVKNGSSLEWK